MSTTEQVRRQYEEFPYPFRDPIEEAKHTRFAYSDYLDAVNHHCFGGRRDFHRDFRVLVAGGGTGDSLVFLAEQLAHTDNEIVYIDLSRASSDIARRRLEAKGLGRNVRMILDSLLKLPDMDIGAFDYINCTGVLHHLDDPARGLGVLSSLLRPDGAMHLMVYGRYGRGGIYPMQKLMRLLNRGENDMHRRIQRTRRVLEQLPPTNWFRRLAPLFDTSHDTELFDLLLHCKDRPFSVPELIEWLAAAGLHYIESDFCDRPFFMQPLADASGHLAARVMALPRERRMAVAEVAWGLIRKQAFWATRRPGPLHAPFDDPDFIPFFTRNGCHASVREKMLASPGLVFRMETEYQFNGTETSLRVAVPLILTPIVRRFLKRIDNRRTLGELVDEIARLEATPPRIVLEQFVEMARTLASRDLLLLRHKSTTPLRWSCDPPTAAPPSDRVDAAQRPHAVAPPHRTAVPGTPERSLALRVPSIRVPSRRQAARSAKNRKRRKS